MIEIFFAPAVIIIFFYGLKSIIYFRKISFERKKREILRDRLFREAKNPANPDRDEAFEKWNSMVVEDLKSCGVDVEKIRKQTEEL